jgi:tetratricopeptide (TPR) repeat protein
MGKMASILPGFEYDIFISYRQKDNKYDGWVTDFVDNLQRELEATFKEEISVYFDINPHDGLLETHDVDASLKEKLKCLVFVPIISRTYCDPVSFAWEHEFIAFIDQTSSDRLGLKVKLPNGSVGSRILPVRIYDLDPADIKLCESVLGGVLRGVDFVYKEPGVNRPLTADDDEKKNLNNTKYRNQINKTANAIKEIISGLKSDIPETGKEKISGMEPVSNIIDKKVSIPVPENKISKVPGKTLLIPIILIIFIIGAFAVYKSISRTQTGKSIAVFFEPIEKGDSSLMVICDLYTESLYEKLVPVRRLAVRPRSAMLQYRGKGKTINEMVKELNVDYFLYGNASKSGVEILLWAELTSIKNNKVLWSGKYTWGNGMISKISSEMAQKIAQNLNTKLTNKERKRMRTGPTSNPEAEMNYTRANKKSYDAFMSITMANKYSDYISFNSAIKEYDKAIEADPTIAEAYAKRAIARAWGYYTRQLDSTQITRCLDDIKRAEELNNDFTDLYIAKGFYYYYCIMDFEIAKNYFKTATEKDPDGEQPLFYLAMVYRRMGEWEESFKLIRKLIALDPQEALTLTNIGLTYTYFHDWDSALLYHQKAIDNMPAWPSPYKNKIETLILKYGNTLEARSLLDTAINKTGTNLMDVKIELDIYDKKYSDALLETGKYQPAGSQYKGEKYLSMAGIYSYLKNSKKALKYYDSALVSLKTDLEYNNYDHKIHSYIGLAYAGLNDKYNAIEEGRKAMDMIEYDNLDKSDMILNLAKIYTITGEIVEATGTIEYLLQKPMKIPSCLSLKLLEIDPVWEPLIKSQEFKVMQKKLN